MLDSIWDLVQTLLGLGEGDPNAGQMAVRAVATFVITVAIVRFGDRRMFGKGTVFDTVVAIMIGSVMSRAITDSSPILATWIAGLVLVLAHRILALLSFRLDWFGPLVKGNRLLLIKDGEVQQEGMQEGNVSWHDLEQALREQGNMTEPSNVEVAYLERDGSISVVPAEAKPRILDISVADGVQTVRIAME